MVIALIVCETVRLAVEEHYGVHGAAT